MLRLAIKYILTVLFWSLTLSVANAATYTVCTSGCSYTSFASLFSAVDLAGDDIVEAQADTPGGSRTFTENIIPGSNDAGTSGHQLIIRARSGDSITIDGEDTRETSNGLIVLGDDNDYVTIDGFTVRDYIYAGIMFNGTSHSAGITGAIFQNNTIYATSSTVAQYGFNMVGGDSIQVLNNHVEIAATANVEQVDCFITGAVDGIVFDGNTCLSLNTSGVGHNDGIQVVGGNGSGKFTLGSASDFTVINNTFVHNNSHADAKQLLYFEYEVGGTNLIYNNVFYCTTGSASNLVSIDNKSNGTNGTFEFYNNTIYTTTGTAVDINADSGDVTFKNNIVYAGSGTLVAVDDSEIVASKFENNQYYTTSGNPFFDTGGSKSWSAWTTAGWDNDYSNFSDPDFMSTSAYPYNLRVNIGSDAIDDGATIGSFSTDIEGTSRPQGSSWDIGAYEYQTKFSLGSGFSIH